MNCPSRKLEKEYTPYKSFLSILGSTDTAPVKYTFGKTYENMLEALQKVTPNPISCIIVDDDPIASKLIQLLVEKTNFLQLEQICKTPLEASQCLNEKHISLMFLDIEMPEMTGLELIETIEKKPEIILISSKKDYVQDAFEKEVADYLIKPVDNYARFLKAVNKAIKRIKSSKNTHHQLFIKAGSLLHNLTLSDILWIEAYGDFVKVCTAAKTYIVLGRLKNILEKLPAADFVQIHRSYIIRLDKVKNIDNSNLQVEKKILPVSKSFKQQLMGRINTV